MTTVSWQIYSAGANWEMFSKSCNLHPSQSKPCPLDYSSLISLSLNDCFTVLPPRARQERRGEERGWVTFSYYWELTAISLMSRRKCWGISVTFRHWLLPPGLQTRHLVSGGCCYVEPGRKTGQEAERLLCVVLNHRYYCVYTMFVFFQYFSKKRFEAHHIWESKLMLYVLSWG